MSEVFYCYVVLPIDDLEHYSYAEDLMTRQNPETPELRREVCLSTLVALERGWHGDGIGPYVFYYPDGAGGNLSNRAFIFKQEKSGWTYIVSRNELSWLSQADCEGGDIQVVLDMEVK